MNNFEAFLEPNCNERSRPLSGQSVEVREDHARPQPEMRPAFHRVIDGA